MNKIIMLCLGAAAAALSATPAQAAANHEAVPTAWRLENYVNGQVTVWYTGAPGCTNGRIGFTSAWTENDKNRFWSLVLSAKMAGKVMGIYYDGSGDSCTFASFYIGP